LAQAARLPEVRTIELHESVELSQSLVIPRPGLVLRSQPGKTLDVVFSGDQAYGMGWETWVDVGRHGLRCERVHFRCRNDMRQTQAVFGIKAGNALELFDCMVTMEYGHDAPTGACVLIGEADKSRDSAGNANAHVPSSSNFDSEPVAVSIRNCIVRGNLSLVVMRAACRAEVSMEKSCAILEGRLLNIRGFEQDRMPPVVRLNLESATLACRQGFALIQTSFAPRAPLTLLRTAKLCAFWSPPTVPHIAIDGISDEETLEEMLQMRGEENAYDQNIDTLCQCRFADGRHIDYSFRDATDDWFHERYNDNSLRWQNHVPPERAMDEQVPDDYRLRSGMFMPGFHPPQTSVVSPPRLESGSKD
jgi:hypothetical protein